MCRSIKTLRGVDPPATPADVQAAARQFVRKLSGFDKPSRANEAAFEAAVGEIAEAAEKLLGSLPARAVPRPTEGVEPASPAPDAATA